MRTVAALTILGVLPPVSFAAGQQLTWQDKVEIIRGLEAEYATAKVLIPRSKKALEFNSDGTYDKKGWTATARESGPAARTGDTIQITKITIGTDRLVLELNHGFKGGSKWYDGVNVGMGPSMDPATVPISRNGDSNAPAGTSLVILFHKELEPIKAAEIKKMLAPVMDFEKHSATELYSEALPPEVQKAVREKRALVGMTHEQVLMAMGRPQQKSREPDADGGETEDWVFGVPPGRITFVTFNGDKVIKVKEDYAGLGTIANPAPVVK